jgi:hypothetical protein
MSLVHEALRKAEREKQRKVGNAPPAAHPAPPQPVHASVVHAPVAPVSVAPATRNVVAHKSTVVDQSAPMPRESKDANHILLPALIGCVAIVAIIAIVFLVSSASSVLRQSTGSPATAAAQAAPAPTAKSTVSPEPQPAAQEAAQMPVESAAPPSAPPPVTTAADGSKFTLTGIMQDPDGKYVAVINGHVMYEGSSIGGATVKSIDREHAVLDINGHEMPLRMF